MHHVLDSGRSAVPLHGTRPRTHVEALWAGEKSRIQIVG
jgi:hypothetical protein